jgi:hypothetical protein
MIKCLDCHRGLWVNGRRTFCPYCSTKFVPGEPTGGQRFTLSGIPSHARQLIEAGHHRRADAPTTSPGAAA